MPPSDGRELKGMVTCSKQDAVEESDGTVHFLMSSSPLVQQCLKTVPALTGYVSQHRLGRCPRYKLSSPWYPWQKRVRNERERGSNVSGQMRVNSRNKVLSSSFILKLDKMSSRRTVMSRSESHFSGAPDRRTISAISMKGWQVSINSEACEESEGTLHFLILKIWQDLFQTHNHIRERWPLRWLLIPALHQQTVQTTYGLLGHEGQDNQLSWSKATNAPSLKKKYGCTPINFPWMQQQIPPNQICIQQS